MDNWIRTADKMPPVGQSVLIYRKIVYKKGVDPIKGPIEHERDWITNGIWTGSRWTYYGYEAPDVTHWMPLPEPPKEAQG